jgi:hypothetical protein
LLRLDECIYDSPNDDGLPKALRCSFEVHVPDNAPNFVALSYTWGSEVFRENILTIDEEWPLRENLCDAMLHISGMKDFGNGILSGTRRERSALWRRIRKPLGRYPDKT